MQPLSKITVGIVAVFHIGIAIAEIFFWKNHKVYGRFDKTFHFTEPEAANVAPIVANAGIYNGFIAAGLLWSLCPMVDSKVALFFLTCVVIAGIFGAATLKKAEILLLQTAPALVAIALVWLGK